MQINLDEIFKYKIGAMLAHRAMLTGGKEDAFCAKMFVVGRLLEECPGGIQKFYLVRIVGVELSRSGLTESFVRVHEVELVEIPEHVK